jgi:RNase P subunit RPR2
VENQSKKEEKTMPRNNILITINKPRHNKPVHCTACGAIINIGEKAVRKESRGHKTRYLCLKCACKPILVYPISKVKWEPGFKRSN